MFPHQGHALDKENDIAAEATAAARGPIHATLVKQASILGSRTPSSKQPANNKSLLMTPSQKGKGALVAGTPTGQSILRAKTNQQQQPLLPPATNNNATTDVKKNALARTFSAAHETAPGTPSAPENRRRSLTRRGSAKTRLVVHQDSPQTGGTEESPMAPIKHMPRLNKPVSLETTTTLLSIERAVESQEKVVVGPAETRTKRRALTNDEDSLEIEYGPSSSPEEQRFDPGYSIDYEVFSTAPTELAYQARFLYDEPDVLGPVFEDSIARRPRSDDEADEEDHEPDVEDKVAVPTVSITPDRGFHLSWEGEEGQSDSDHHVQGNHLRGIADFQDESRTRPPFDDFMFEFDCSDDSLSEDEDDILGGSKLSTVSDPKELVSTTDKHSHEFNETFGLEDLEDESKVGATFDDFAFQL